MLDTAMRHFGEDIDRARSLVIHARPLPDDVLRGDILLMACMTALSGARSRIRQRRLSVFQIDELDGAHGQSLWTSASQITGRPEKLQNRP